MELWIMWWSLVQALRPAFSRTRTFLWFAASLAAMCVRSDHMGVTSLVRALGLKGDCYDRLLDFFHSPGVKLEVLTRLWTRLVIATFKLFLYTVKGRLVLLADGIKIPKAGRKMPAVKTLHQSSDNNNKPKFIFGHSCQAIALVTRAAGSFMAIPLACRIHEGIILTKSNKHSLLDKLILLVNSLAISAHYYVVADSYYAAAKVIKPLLKSGQHLITSVRMNAVAYEQAPPPAASRRGRRPLYAGRVNLKGLFRQGDTFTSAISPIYGEKNVTLRYRVLDLCWRSVGHLVRFVLVIHPTRGKKILLSTDLSLDPLEIIKTFGVRFKIEACFKQAIYTIGTYAYHFWLKTMTPRNRHPTNQRLYDKPEPYRYGVLRKIHAYHVYIQLGIIAQGILQTLALSCTNEVWKHFGSWIRTIRPGILPSELIAAIALRHTLPEFLADSHQNHILGKFIRNRIDFDRSHSLFVAA